jgi:peptide/nickel transport system substrate-binding protein
MQKFLVGIIAIMLYALGSGTCSFGEPTPAPRGELRIVDRQDFNYASIVLNVFEHLIEIDRDGKLIPGLATSWQWLNDRTLEFKLRQGVKFHNGEIFDAEIVKLNWEENLRLKQPFVIGEFMNFKPGSRLEVLDPQTVRFIFPEPDGGALARISQLHIGNRQFHAELGWGEKHW